jgi:hypothetical protein
MRPLALLLACSCAALAQAPSAPAVPENLIKNGGFEIPEVKAPTNERDGANPSRAADGQSSWMHFLAPAGGQDKAGGELVVGMTNTFAHSGKQSIFIDFKEATAQRRSFLTTDIIPVKPGQLYRVALWGRIDAKRPLSLDQRRPLMKLDFDYFSQDTETQSEKSDHGTQIIPGSLDRMMFFSTKWIEYFRLVRPPADAAWMKITFRWETDKAPGKTDGVIYFDDVSVVAVPGGESLAPGDPIPPKPAEPDEEKQNQ